MLLNLQSALKDREKQLTRWWRNPYALVVGGVLLAYVARPFGIALCIAGVLGCVAQFRMRSGILKAAACGMTERTVLASFSSSASPRGTNSTEILI